MLPTPAALVEVLRTCNLLDPAQLAQATRLATSVADAKALAGELIRRGWLTPYQANLLLQGRDGELIVGAYVLLEKLGEGGMGHVFKARHVQLGRVVAIKLIRKERLANPQAIKRFHREVKVAAQLEHPNVVHALDAGEANGVHYLVMEYVDGIDLARWVKQRGPLPADQACEFIRQTALGLQHAFECGMVHRDIKPANLLVGAAPASAPGGGSSGSGLKRRPAVAAATAAPQAPPAAYQIKILDMGLARTIEASDEEETTSLLTREGTVMGTADYMAPEQAVASHDVDIRADLYSLGCTLYYLLSGRVPFPGGTMAQKLLCHQSNEPTPLEELCPEISESVVAVARTLMAKRREHRFQTPAELAQALADIALGKTISVRRPVVAEHPGDMALADTNPFADLGTDEEQPLPAAKPLADAAAPGKPRHDPRIGVLIAVAVIVLALLISGIIAWKRSASRTRAGDEGQPLEKKVAPAAAGDLTAVAAKAHEQRCADAETALTAVTTRANAALTADQLSAARQDLRRFLAEHSGTPAATKACELLGQVLAKIPSPLDALPATKLPELSDYWTSLGHEPPKEIVDALGEHRGRFWSTITVVAFSPDGKLAAVGGQDGLIRLVTASNLACKAVLRGHEQTVLSLAFSKDGRKLLSGSQDYTVRIWDVEKGIEIKQCRGSGTHSHCVAFSPDEQLILSGRHEGLLQTFDADSGVVVSNYVEKTPGRRSAMFCADGRRILSVSPDGVRLWDTESAKEIKHLLNHSAVLSPDGRSLLAWSEPEGARLVDAETGEEAHKLEASVGTGTADFSPDGRQAITGGSDGAIHVWDATNGQKLARLGGDMLVVQRVLFRPKSRHAISISSDKTMRLWELDSKSELLRLKNQDAVHGVYPDGSFAWKSEGLCLHRWELPGGKVQNHTGHAAAVATVAFLGDSAVLASAQAGSQVRLWNLSPKKEHTMLAAHPEATAMAVSPDGKTLAWRDKNNVLRFRDIDTKKQSTVDMPGALISTSFSPDGKRLASVHAGKGGLVLWDVAKKTQLHHSKGDTRCAAFSPSGTELAVAFGEQMIYILDANTLQLQHERRWQATNGPVTCLTYSPDGRLLAGNGKELKIWDVDTGTERISLPAGVPAFAPDGRSLAVAAKDKVQLYAVDTGSKMREWDFPGVVHAIAFAADGRHLATANANGTVYILRLASAVQ